MEEKRKKKLTESNKQKLKKKNVQEKKTATESLDSKISSPNQSMENVVVVGKGLSRFKSDDLEIPLHVCDALAVIPSPECDENFKERILKEDLEHIPSNISFISAKSDVSEAQLNNLQNLEDAVAPENTNSSNLKAKIGKKEHSESSCIAIEPVIGLRSINFQEMEKILNIRERKIKYLQNKIEECCKDKDKQVEENRGLTYQISLLNRQLQSMYELLGKKGWKSPIDPSEFAICKKKIFELETVISVQDEGNKKLIEKIQIISENLEAKERELSAKNKELIDYKNRSTLEVCKLINQIDCLQNQAKLQSELLESKIQEAQKSMDDEIINLTQRLENQYQEDVKNAIEKFHVDFKKLADLPNTAIEKLLKICELEKVDLVTIQKDWDRQQALLESKIQTMQSDHSKELLKMRDSYEGKILFLKVQVETLTSQLKERKEILDVFESELTMFKSNSSMNLLKASTLSDDIPSLKELYTTEIFSQKQVHKLQLNIFEEKVKTLTEEILYHAKNEEIHLQELENAKKMSFVFREKYEQLVAEWEERVEKEVKIPNEVTLVPEIDTMFEEFKSLIEGFKESEGIFEERLKLLETRTNNERLGYLKEIEIFRIKIEQLEKFQKTQAELDESIQELIKALRMNYMKTINALTTSHMTELSLKHLEICSSEKRHIEEMDALKNSHEKEIEELRVKIEKLENSTEFTESERNLRKTQEDEILKKNIEELSLEYLKSQGLISIKEETEQALNDRIQELEDAMKAKDENCRKELEDLTAKFIEIQVLSSAKDELAKEVEDKLSESERMLKKSYKEIDKLQGVVMLMEENLKVKNNYPNDGGDFTTSKEISEKFERAKINGDRLKTKIVEMFDRVEHLEGLNQSSGDANKSLEECERGKILDENRKLKFENGNLVEEVTKMQKTITELEQKNNLLIEEYQDIKSKLKAIEIEKAKLLLKEKASEKEKDEIQQRNEYLEESIQDLTDKMDVMMAELASNKESKEEVFSISLQEVRVLYQEEQETELETEAFGCQTAIDSQPDASIVNLLKINENLKKENACLKMELRNSSKRSLYEEFIRKFKSIQKELLRVVNERDELLTVNEKLRKEKDYFKEEVENLREGLSFREIKVPEIVYEDIQHKSPEMKEEIEKLTEYVKILSAKLDIMRANNDILLSKSEEHLKHNQNLVIELEEAWSQRYEIEEQLAKVRKENALLNQHRNQLEETNRRISSLVAEGKPSVVSWIKIHETVENIVDEVLALKTSFSSNSVSGISTSVEVPKTTSELKMMTETLHVQLKNKTMLCDELIIQKETLEKELKSLESLLTKDPKSPRRCREEPRYWNNRHLDMQNRQTRNNPLEKRQVLEWKGDDINTNRMMRSFENSHLMTLNRLKKHLEDQAEWEESQFRENLELEIKELRTQMQKQDRLNATTVPFEEDQDLLEVRYEQEVVEISQEFAQELKKLKKLFDSEKDENSRERYFEEIDRLKSYFEKRWDDLKKRYGDVYKNQIVQSHLPAGEEKIDNDMGKLVENRHEGMLGKIRAGYETLLEEERKKFNSLLEEAKQKHDREMIALEEFWTEKLSECETKCAIMKATGDRRSRSRGEYQNSAESEDSNSKIEQFCSQEETRLEGNQTKKCLKEVQIYDNNYPAGLKTVEEKPQDSTCPSCLSNQPYLNRMEVKTDDDKLDIILQRDALKEMVTSMRLIISKLLAFIGYQKGNLSSNFDLDDTMYKSIHFDPDRIPDVSDVSNARLSLDLSTIIQDLTENSLLNSSDQVRFELEKVLKQLQKDASSILVLSSSDNIGLKEIIKKFEKEKEKLEGEVLKVENMQREMKKEIALTKERLDQWERNLEVVTEGYGEEVVKPKQMISLCDLKDKLKMFLTDHSMLPSQEINLLEEICKENERLQEEWKREKNDLQLQIDVADKQIQSLKKFLEEQATEREQEREAFDLEVNELKENLKAKERDNSLQNRTNREAGRQADVPLAKPVEALEGQLKELTSQLIESQNIKSAVEEQFQNAVKKIWSLRDVIQELEMQLADISEKECNLKKKVEKLELLVEEQDKINRDLKEELETCQNQNDLQYSNQIKVLEEELILLRLVADQISPDNLTQLNANLRHIESILIKKTKDLEQLHVSSANVSCSSPSEDVSIRDHFDATRCSTPDEMCTVPHSMKILPMEEIERVYEKLNRHTRAEEATMKFVQDLKMQLRNLRKAFEEVQTERDILLEKVDVYLKENSGLKIRLEEQRCNAGLLQKQLNANLESQISRLETDVEKLRSLCDEKDKQLSDLKTTLESTMKSLKARETEALNKSKEENKFIMTLRTDLANALSENEKLEDKLGKMREKLKESMTMPALIDSMLDEKNAEIERLEKEVLRLSNEKTSGISSTSYNTDGKKRRIKFSEPDSFSENISSISPHGSDLRNYSDSFGDFKNFSLKVKRPVSSSTKVESISSIAPLQLSPRGTDSPGIFSWKTSSPVVYKSPETRSPSRTPSKSLPQPDDYQQMLEMSKLRSEIESKHREISELNLETDKLKRLLVETKQELTVAKTQTKEVQIDLATKDDEMRKLKNSEKSLLVTIESLKKNHAEELDELQKKLIFEREKVKKVYEEIKALEVKKVEIEESFLSLKEDYNEKMITERKTAEILLERIKALEIKNEDSEVKLTALEKDMEVAIKDSEETIRKLSKEILELKDENEKMRLEWKIKIDAETQVEPFQEDFILEKQKPGFGSCENIDQLKLEFDKMTAIIGEKDFNKTEAFAYAMAVKKLIKTIMEKLSELSIELDMHKKKLMECSVDDLAVKVQKELLLSATLDNKLLSNIEANAGNSGRLDDIEGGDNLQAHPLPGTDMLKLYKETTKKVSELESEKEHLKTELMEQKKIIRLLEDSLKNEKDRILGEKERCTEDAKIMELLRINLEKGLRDIKVKEKELKREKHLRMTLEKEMEALKKHGVKGWESKKIMELNAQLESQKEKIISIGQLLEEEKRKNQELKLALEESQIERMTEKKAQELMESNLKAVKEQKENLIKELMNSKKLLNSRNVEIRFLKQKVNLQEIDIKALSLSSDIHRQSASESSSLDKISENLGELTLDSDSSILRKMKKLNSCVQHHVKESAEMGETLLYLTQETEQMKTLIRKLEQSEAKGSDEILDFDSDIEKKLWALEKGGLVLDIETLRGENEILKRDLVETCKNTELLRLENSQLKKEKLQMKVAPNQLENEFLQNRVSHLTWKYLRTESYRKALAWQKNFLMITLRNYQLLEEEGWKKMGRKKKGIKSKRSGYFRVIALAVISVFRMKFIVVKWRKNAFNHVHTFLEKENSKQKLVSLASVLNIYNEPFNPLSYQMENIFPQSSSRILRTPPCRDPGPRSYSLDSKKRPNCLDTFSYFEGSIGTAKALP